MLQGKRQGNKIFWWNSEAPVSSGVVCNTGFWVIVSHGDLAEGLGRNIVYLQEGFIFLFSESRPVLVSEYNGEV